MRQLVPLLRLVLACATGLLVALPAVDGADGRTVARQPTVVRVYADDFDFDLARKVLPAGPVIFRITNRGTIEHTFSIRGVTSPTVHVKSTITLRVTLPAAGRYQYYCTIPGHYEWGMHGALRVRPAVSSPQAEGRA